MECLARCVYCHWQCLHGWQLGDPYLLSATGTLDLGRWFAHRTGRFVGTHCTYEKKDQTMLKPRALLPFAIFVLIAVLLWRGLSLAPAEVPSPLIGKPVPEFSLPSLFNPQLNLSQKIFDGHVSVFNVW